MLLFYIGPTSASSIYKETMDLLREPSLLL